MRMTFVHVFIYGWLRISFQQSFSRPTGNPQYPPQPNPMHQNPANPYQNYPVQGQDQTNQNDYLVDEHIDNNYPQYNQYQDFGNGNQQVTYCSLGCILRIELFQMFL